MNDPVVEEIRKYREQYAAKFNYDVGAICRDLCERQASCGRELVSRPPNRVPGTESRNVDAGSIDKRGRRA